MVRVHRGLIAWLVIGMLPVVAAVGADPASAGAAPGGGFVGVEVGRLLDTRPGATTVDGRFSGGGPVPAGGTVAFDVVGRSGVPTDVAAVAVTVTVTEPTGPGFVTLFPCGAVPPTSTVNFARGQTVAGSAISGLSGDGRLCVYSMTQTHVVVDVTGAFADGFTALTGGRLVDTRPAATTSDGLSAATGPIAAGGVLEVQVGGRLGVPVDAEAAAITVTTVGSDRPGYVAVYPCGPRPLASTLNHVAGEVRSNSIVAPLDPAGRLCVFTLAPSHVVLDVTGYVPAGAGYTPTTPARLVDTRFDGTTVDGSCQQVGRVASGTSMSLTVAGRAGVPSSGVGAVVLNVVATGSKLPGFVTAHPAGRAVPVTSMLNYLATDTVAASVVAPVDDNGQVALFSNVGAHLVVDVVGWFPGSSVGSSPSGCAGTFVDPRQRYQRTTNPGATAGCTLLGERDIQCWSRWTLTPRRDEAIMQPVDGRLVELVSGPSPPCALRADGSVACIPGFLYYGWPRPPIFEVPLPRPMVDIAGFTAGMCGIDVDAAVWCWTTNSPTVSAPVRISTSGRALGFLQLRWPEDFILVQTDAGFADQVERVADGVFAVTSSSHEAAPGIPWMNVLSASYRLDTLCLVLVDGRAVCGGSGDLAPTMDVAWNDGFAIRDVAGRTVLIEFPESADQPFGGPPTESPVLIRPSDLAQCYYLSTPSFDGWCQPERNST